MWIGSVGHRVDDCTDIGARRGEIVSGLRGATFAVAPKVHDDGPAPEKGHDLDVVVGDVGHAGHEHDRCAPVIAARVEVVDTDVAVVSEPGDDHGQRHFMRRRTTRSTKACDKNKSIA